MRKLVRRMLKWFFDFSIFLRIFCDELWFVSDKENSYSYSRFVVGSRLTNTEDVEFAWNEIVKHADLMEGEGKMKRVQNI